jgi:hypothetical protein
MDTCVDKVITDKCSGSAAKRAASEQMHVSALRLCGAIFLKYLETITVALQESY